MALWQVEDTLPAACALLAACAKPTISLELSAKPTILGSWRPRRPADGPPGAQDGLPTGLLAPQTGLPTGLLAPETAFGQDGLRTGLLAPKTAS